MNTQKLLSYTRKAVDEYRLIDAHDKIAVGISGGKDSLTLLTALHGLRRFYPSPFTLEAITVDLGNPGFDTEGIQAYCNKLNVPYTCVKTEISRIIFEERKEKNPCSLCAKMRKGALNEAIKARGCNKVAYAHHKDDIIETLFMSLIYEGRINTFSPRTYLDRTDLTVIRPLLFVDEAEIASYGSACDKELLRGRRFYQKGINKRTALRHLPKQSGRQRANIWGHIESGISRLA